MRPDIKIYYDIKTLYNLYIESVGESSPETDLYTYLILAYNTGNVTNKLTVDTGTNDYLNRKSKTVSIPHIIHKTSYRWIKSIKIKF